MKTVLITGASRGIGEACARIFGENGWKVYLNCRNNVKLLEELQKDIPESVVLPFDVSDKKAVHHALNDLHIDCLAPLYFSIPYKLKSTLFNSANSNKALLRKWHAGHV